MAHWAEVILVQMLDFKKQEGDDQGNKASSGVMDGD